MANYTKATNFTAKDSLPSGNAGKIIKGAEIDTEFTAIASAIASKSDINSPTFTGTPAAPTANAGTNTTQIATTAFVNTSITAERTATTTLTNKTLSVDDNTISGIAASSFVLSNSSGNIDGSASQKVIPTGAVVGTTDTQTLTNKTLTSPIITNIASSLITMGTAVSANATSIDFTSIPSWVKRVSLILNGVGTNGTSSYLVQIGSGSITTSGYSSGGNRASTATPLTATSTSGFIIHSGASGGGKTGIFTIVLMDNANNYVFNGTAYAPSEPNQYVSAGNVTLNDVLDRIRITTVNGTDVYNAGTINILYE